MIQCPKCSAVGVSERIKPTEQLYSDKPYKCRNCGHQFNAKPKKEKYI